MSTFGVIIVTWNSSRYLENCLSSLASQTRPPDVVLVMDNNSTDTSVDIARRFPGVRVISLHRNLGFAQANNLAVKDHVDTDWVVLLNPDAFPEPGWLAALEAAALKSPGYAAFGSRMLSYDDPGILDGTGDCFHPCGMAWRRGHGGGAKGRYEADDDIFSPCAAAAMYRRDLFLFLGGFDGDLFCYFEDVDLGFRIHLAGHRCRYVSGAVVRHVGAGSLGKYSEFELYHGHRNLVWCWVANMPGRLFWMLLPLHILFNAVSICYMTWLGYGRILVAAKLDALRHIKTSIKKRRQAARFNPGAGRILSVMTLNPFKRGKKC